VSHAGIKYNARNARIYVFLDNEGVDRAEDASQLIGRAG
jgi:hypothetical protein